MDENTKFEKALKLFFLIAPIIMGISFLYGFFNRTVPADCKRGTEDFEINYQLNSTKKGTGSGLEISLFRNAVQKGADQVQKESDQIFPKNQ